MLCQINYLRPQQTPLVSVWLVKVNRHKLIANLRCEFAVIHRTVVGHCLQKVVLVYLLFELSLVVILAVVLFALVLGPLLPAILIEAVSKHKDELHDLLVVPLVDHLTAVSQIEHKYFICCQHISFCLR